MSPHNRKLLRLPYQYHDPSLTTTTTQSNSRPIKTSSPPLESKELEESGGSHTITTTATTTTSNYTSSTCCSYNNITIKPPLDSAMALTVLVLLTALFFMGFFSIYIRRFADESSVDPTRRRGRGSSSSTSSSGLSSNTVSYLSRGPVKGVDPSVVKGLKVQEYYNGGGAKQGMECAICLSEVEEREWIKELPVCGHVFHVECIDIWLESHVTCPLCRADVEVVREGDVVVNVVVEGEVELGVGEVQGSESREVRLEVDGRDTWREERARDGEVGPVGVRRTNSCSWCGERLVLHRSLSF